MSRPSITYKTKLFLYFSVFNLVCILIMSVTLYALLYQNLRENYDKTINANVSEIVKGIDDKTNYVENIAKNFLLDKTFYANINKKYDLLTGTQMLDSYLLQKGKSVISLSNISIGITLYVNNETIPEHYYNGTGDLKPDSTFNVKHTYHLTGKDYYEACNNSALYLQWMQIDDDKDKGLISLVVKLGYIYGSEDSGVMIIKSPIEEVVKNSVPGADGMELYYCVLDENKNSISSNISGKDKQFYNKYERNRITGVMDNGWTLEVYMPISNISEGRANILFKIGLLALIIIVTNLIIAYILSKRAYCDVNIILSGIRRYQDGIYDNKIETVNKGEFKEIAVAINKFVDEIQHLIDDVYEVALQKQDIELHMLRAKINPHFLSNIFNLIIQLSEKNDNDRIVQLVKDTSLFYRKTLSQCNDDITLLQECNVVEAYLGIIDLLKPNAVIRTYDISPEAKRCSIPAFIIQPIVENCVYHGMIDNRININISANVSDNILTIKVKDDGIGMKDEDIEELYKIKPNHGYGMYSILMRIKLKYPDDKYGVFVSSEYGRGTEIAVIIPSICEDEMENL